MLSEEWSEAGNLREWSWAGIPEMVNGISCRRGKLERLGVNLQGARKLKRPGQNIQGSKRGEGGNTTLKKPRREVVISRDK